jgi:hypothetical protein
MTDDNAIHLLCLTDRLRRAAESAWAESGRLARLTHAGLATPAEFREALDKAIRASKQYQSVAGEGGAHEHGSVVSQP